jgi:hypothetical protein
MVLIFLSVSGFIFLHLFSYNSLYSHIHIQSICLPLIVGLVPITFSNISKIKTCTGSWHPSTCYNIQLRQLSINVNILVYILFIYVFCILLKCKILIDPQIVFNIKKLINTIMNLLQLSTSTNIPIHLK